MPENVVELFKRLEEAVMDNAPQSERVRTMISIMSEILGEKQ